MRTERSTEEMLAAILDARRALRQARLRCANCPERMRDWCRQEAEWCAVLLHSLEVELSLRDDAHAIETALRFLLSGKTPGDAC